MLGAAARGQPLQRTVHTASAREAKAGKRVLWWRAPKCAGAAAAARGAQVHSRAPQAATQTEAERQLSSGEGGNGRGRQACVRWRILLGACGVPSGIFKSALQAGRASRSGGCWPPRGRQRRCPCMAGRDSQRALVKARGLRACRVRRGGIHAASFGSRIGSRILAACISPGEAGFFECDAVASCRAMAIAHEWRWCVAVRVRL